MDINTKIETVMGIGQNSLEKTHGSVLTSACLDSCCHKNPHEEMNKKFVLNIIYKLRKTLTVVL